MLVNDVDKMGFLIENHALEHKCKEANTSKAEQIFDRIQDLLINQVFEKACKK